ncbi:hypothetical protein L9F63_005286, partial [Diploptera punctata]
WYTGVNYFSFAGNLVKQTERKICFRETGIYNFKHFNIFYILISRKSAERCKTLCSFRSILSPKIHILNYWCKNIKAILSGNSDTASVVSHRLMPPVYASKVRVLPYSVHRRTVCLRVELRGCLAEGDIIILTTENKMATLHD